MKDEIITDINPIDNSNTNITPSQERIDINNSINIDKEINYTITIIEEDKINNISLNNFNKNIITFGRNNDNDIVLSSLLISGRHGYFSIDNGIISIYDNNSTNGIYINSKKETFGILRDSDFIKIDNPDEPLSMGIIMIITIGNRINKWIDFSIKDKKIISIGRGNDCDIVLNRISISLKHAKINLLNGGYYISSYDNKSGIILNNRILIGQKKLKNKDVILINNIKLIYDNDKIFYQSYDEGVRIDAIDILKTVKVKGKKKEISQHIDFSANPGEFIAFVGGSGTGKSTFLKCISGVSKPTSGKVFINGNDLFNNYSVLKNLIGYVPQDNIIFDNLTLIDMLKYAANLRMPDDATTTEKKDRIKRVLEIVELSDKKDIMIRNLSGGQRKRANIAVELIADPKLFFLDEPTSGLDPGTERSIMQTLRKMADSGKTIILVTHNTLNLNLCDKIIFFGRGGKLCFNGKSNEALTFFGVNDLVDVYNLLNNDTDKWNLKFSSSNYKKNSESSNIELVSNNNKKKSKSFFKQFKTLLMRRIKNLFNNSQQLLLLFGQAPLIACLLTIFVDNDLFYSYEITKSILFTISTAAIWLGLLNAIQEICKERVILEKEYMADLRLSAYVCSKLVFLLLLAVIQSTLLITCFILLVDVPSNGVFFSWYFESIITIFLTIFSASSMGLFVSILAKDTSSASFMPPLLLVSQLMFSGMLFPLTGVIDKISNFILSKWSMEALGTTNDLNALISSVQEVIPGYVRETEAYYNFTIDHLNHSLFIIILMAAIFTVVSYITLKKQLESGK